MAREAAAAAERAAADTADIGEFMRRLLAEGEAALARTPELLAVLKEAGVVDAGGKGFVRMLEGVVRYIEGDPILPLADANGSAGSPVVVPAAEIEIAAERDFQFCTEVLVRGEQLPSSNEVRAALASDPLSGHVFLFLNRFAQPSYVLLGLELITVGLIGRLAAARREPVRIEFAASAA